MYKGKRIILITYEITLPRWVARGDVREGKLNFITNYPQLSISDMKTFTLQTFSMKALLHLQFQAKVCDGVALSGISPGLSS